VDLIDLKTHSFVIKIWIEGSSEGYPPTSWRGHITHVPSGERRYLKDLDGIKVFIAPYLRSVGVELGVYWRARGWLRRCAMYFKGGR
jgi:hypothetical protein